MTEKIELKKFQQLQFLPTIDKRDFVHAAEKIAEEILGKAIRADNDISWIDISVGVHGEWMQAVKPGGIYDGTDGIALFFLYLHQLTGKSKYKEVFASILNRSLIEMDKIAEKEIRHGATISPMLFPQSYPFQSAID